MFNSRLQFFPISKLENQSLFRIGRALDSAIICKFDHFKVLLLTCTLSGCPDVDVLLDLMNIIPEIFRADQGPDIKNPVKQFFYYQDTLSITRIFRLVTITFQEQRRDSTSRGRQRN